MRSAIYSGIVQHRRFSPKAHDFKYKVFMPFIDLDELDTIFLKSLFWSVTKNNLASLKRRDFFGDKEKSIKDSIISCAQQKLGKLPIRRVCLLANLRYFGHSFNPISTYYCYDKDDTLLCIVAEVTNTPWKEKHCYVIPNLTPDKKQLSAHFSKDFHVSPFLPMEMSYRWQSNVPGEKLYIHMQNFSSINSEKIFDATIILYSKEITPRTLDAMILKYPFMTLQVVLGIYWQAFRIFMKGMHFYSHPEAT
jgi:DUF1365 family protein